MPANFDKFTSWWWWRWHWNRINIRSSQSKTCDKLCFESQHCKQGRSLYLQENLFFPILRLVAPKKNKMQHFLFKNTLRRENNIREKFYFKLRLNVQSPRSQQCWTLKTKTICFLSQTKAIWQETHTLSQYISKNVYWQGL